MPLNILLTAKITKHVTETAKGALLPGQIVAFVVFPKTLCVFTIIYNNLKATFLQIFQPHVLL